MARTSLAEFCHLLALLLESNLPLPEALRLTGEGVQDADLDETCHVMAGQVTSGQSLAQAMTEKKLFPQGLPSLLRWAERDKSLPEVLHMAGAMFECALPRTRRLPGLWSPYCASFSSWESSW